MTENSKAMADDTRSECRALTDNELNHVCGGVTFNELFAGLMEKLGKIRDGTLYCGKHGCTDASGPITVNGK